MSDGVLIALIVLTGQIIQMIYNGRQMNKVKTDVGVVRNDVAMVKHHTNSLIEQAVEDSRTIGHSEGVAQEKMDQAERDLP